MNEENFRSFARWVRDSHKFSCEKASRSARRMSYSLDMLADRADERKPEVDMSTEWPTVIAAMSEAKIMAEILDWVEHIEQEDN